MGLTIYLLVAGGFKGGEAIAEAGSTKVRLPGQTARALGALIPLWTFPSLRFGGKLSAMDTAAIAAVLRFALAMRFPWLVSELPKLQLLVGVLRKSLSAMSCVSLLLALLFPSYAVAGIHLFGAHDPRNFGSLPAAFLSLFRLGPLDNWADLLNTQLAHVAGLKVTIYFVPFIVFGTMIILNLFIGIIMNSMAEMHAEMAERDRAQHEHEIGSATLDDELKSLERELKETQTRLASLRRKWSNSAPPRSRAEQPEGLTA